MNRTWTLLALLLSLLTTACQPIRPAAAVQASALSEEEQFIKVALDLEQAYQNEDLESVLAFYAADAVSHAPGFPTDAGKDAIKVAYQSYFDAYTIERDFTLTDVQLAGNFATRTGEWTQVLTPQDGSTPITEIGRCILGWKKVEGEWKVAWEIWNTYAATPQ